ncbi:hypothetical protein ACH9DO_16475 [Kocuria sp. M1N1S27]|uniref:hypothetical protein n=1 Tax=Kocuria kalidii TaxID=3376283 RepID=UPI0037923ACC
MVFVAEMPEDLRPGDEVEATDIIAAGDIFDEPIDRDPLLLLTDEETANYLVNRDSEPHLVDATVTELD